MKKLLSFLAILLLIVFASCSEENAINNSLTNTQQEPFRVQGQVYDLSKSKLKSSNLVTRSSTSSGDPNFTMEDIKFWVGTGSKKAALVIEWHDGKNPDALVWGYKWDGSKYGIDMIRDIVNVDPRLTLLTHMTGSTGYTIAGLGYDINKNGNHYLIYNNDANNPIYPENGIVSATGYNYDNWSYSDPADHWLSGWNNGYWSYFTKDAINDMWEYSQWGASSRELVDGSWDGWSFLDDMNEWEGKSLGNKFTTALPN